MICWREKAENDFCSARHTTVCVDARLRDQRVFSIASSGEDADTESIPSQDFQDHRSVSEDGSQDGVSIADADPEPDEVVERVEFLQFAPPGRCIREGFASPNDVDLMQLFRRRGHVMRSVPQVIKGACTATMRVSFYDVEVEVRAWKLFLLFPRMLLFRPARGGKVSKGHLMERLYSLSSGQWAQLIARSSQISQEVASISMRRRRREAGLELERRAARAEQLAALEELSAGRQLLEGAAIAPGNMRTSQTPARGHVNHEACWMKIC